MKKILTLFYAGVLMSTLCAGLVACNEPKEPEPPATFDGFSIGDDGWIESPQWLADLAKRSGYGDFYYPSIYLVRYKGVDYICLDDALASNFFLSQWFWTLSGESVIDYDIDEGPPSDEMRNLLSDMREALKKEGVLIWRRPSKNTSASTRADIRIP